MKHLSFLAKKERLLCARCKTREMIRSLFLAILLSLSIAGLALSFSGKAELSDSENFYTSSSQVLSSPEARALIVEKITENLWQRVDIQKEIENLLPPEAAILSAPAETAAKGAFSAALDKILEQSFVENIWAPGAQVEKNTSLLEDGQSALLLTKESAYLDTSEILRAAAGDLGLPSVIKNNIPSLGKVELAERQSVVRVQTTYNVLSISPLVFLPAVLLLLAALFVSERRTLWRGGLFLGGGLVLSALLLLFLQATLPPYFIGNTSDPMSLALAQYIWQDWSSGLNLIIRSIFVLSIPIILLSALATPSVWQKVTSVAREEDLRVDKKEKGQRPPETPRKKKEKRASPIKAEPVSTKKASSTKKSASAKKSSPRKRSTDASKRAAAKRSSSAGASAAKTSSIKKSPEGASSKKASPSKGRGQKTKPTSQKNAPKKAPKKTPQKKSS